MLKSMSAALCFVLALPAFSWAECPPEPGLERFAGQGWGIDVANRRFQDDSLIGRDNVSDLQVAWVFGLDGGLRPHSYPAVTEDTVFIGSEGGKLYALDRDSGCERWLLDVGHAVRSAVIHGRTRPGEVRLFLGTQDGDVHAVDAATGAHLWKRPISQHSFAVPTGTPSFFNDRLFVPVSSFEVAMAMVPLYGCCTFRGALLALDAATGELLWQTRLGRGGYLGGVHWGLAVNEALELVYVPISDDNSGQVQGESAAGLHALDLQSGQVVWRHASHGDCEDKLLCWSGFSAAILATPELVFAGSLDGMLRAFDAGTGEVLWSFQTWDTFDSVNGHPTFGGAIDVHGPMLFEDTLLIQSGYSTFAQAGGNALIAFSVSSL